MENLFFSITIKHLENIINVTVNFIWGNVLWLVLGAGILFTFYCRFVPFRYLWHGIQILRGKYDNENDPGQLSHFQSFMHSFSKYHWNG